MRVSFRQLEDLCAILNKRQNTYAYSVLAGGRAGFVWLSRQATSTAIMAEALGNGSVTHPEGTAPLKSFLQHLSNRAAFQELEWALAEF